VAFSAGSERLEIRTKRGEQLEWCWQDPTAIPRSTAATVALGTEADERRVSDWVIASNEVETTIFPATRQIPVAWYPINLSPLTECRKTGTWGGIERPGNFHLFSLNRDETSKSGNPG
jgi:hypothetical protein